MKLSLENEILYHFPWDNIPLRIAPRRGHKLGALLGVVNFAGLQGIEPFINRKSPVVKPNNEVTCVHKTPLDRQVRTFRSKRIQFSMFMPFGGRRRFTKNPLTYSTGIYRK
jgi:hypothetical protein